MAELTPKQQVVEILKNNQKFLLLTHKNPDGDALGGILAFQATLARLGKEAAMVCDDVAPSVFEYLPKVSEISQNLTTGREFVISLDVSTIKAEKVMYKVVDNKLNIIVTPDKGQFDESMITSSHGGFSYDAIIVLDSPDLERLGTIYEKNPEVFYEVPVVNIDHHAGNDNFGKINLVDLTATSTSEILVSIIEALTGDSKFFDENIATALLTGIITDTNSFQNTNTTPKSLTVAAQLVAQGARQQDIIKNIYKTRPLSTLRLWGRALSNIHDEKDYNFVWSGIYAKDYLEVGATPDESSGLIDELLKTASGVDFALLLTEKDGNLCGSLRSVDTTKNVADIAKLFSGGGHPVAAGFQIDGTNLLESSDMVISKIKEFQKAQMTMIGRKESAETNPVS